MLLNSKLNFWLAPRMVRSVLAKIENMLGMNEGIMVDPILYG